MQTGIKEKLQSMSFQLRIALLLMAFTMLSSLAVWHVMAGQYKKEMIAGASEAVHSVVSANNEVLHMTLKQVEDGAQMMLNDKEYYDFFSGLPEAQVSDYMSYSRLIGTAMVRQFSIQTKVYTTWLWTSRWMFGNSRSMSVSGEGILHSGLLELAEKAGGNSCWLGGYDFGQVMGSSWLQEKSFYDYQYPITLIRQMRFQYSDFGAYHVLPQGEEWPVLFVFILEEDIREIYENSVSYVGSICGITDENGKIISSDSENFPPAGQTPEEIFSHMGKSGYAQCSLEGREYLLCFDSLKDPGWLSWALVPMDTLVKDTMEQMERMQLLFLFLFLLLSALAAWVVSGTVTKPVSVLAAAAERVSTGNFSVVTPVPTGGDFRLLTESFNHMVREIDKLIRENYLIKLEQKEAQLTALSMQINPHFLYNTLNIINMLALQNGDEETSDLIVSLSEMLQYTLKKENGKIWLKEELGWASNYLHIMEKRYDGRFLADMEVQEELVDCLVPRFFLQPLVENAILHGFRNMKSGGHLRIIAEKKGNQLHILVEDNGRGMDEKTRRAYLAGMPEQSGIGVSNVHERLKLIYGETYERRVISAPGKGCCIHLYLPFEKEKTDCRDMMP